MHRNVECGCKDILKDHPELDAERVWNEISEHRSDKSEKLDLGELAAVSGGQGPRLGQRWLRRDLRNQQLVQLQRLVPNLGRDL